MKDKTRKRAAERGRQVGMQKFEQEKQCDRRVPREAHNSSGACILRFRMPEYGQTEEM